MDQKHLVSPITVAQVVAGGTLEYGHKTRSGASGTRTVVTPAPTPSLGWGFGTLKITISQ